MKNFTFAWHSGPILRQLVRKILCECSVNKNIKTNWSERLPLTGLFHPWARCDWGPVMGTYRWLFSETLNGPNQEIAKAAKKHIVFRNEYTQFQYFITKTVKSVRPYQSFWSLFQNIPCKFQHIRKTQKNMTEHIWKITFRNPDIYRFAKYLISLPSI